MARFTTRTSINITSINDVSPNFSRNSQKTNRGS